MGALEGKAKESGLEQLAQLEQLEQLGGGLEKERQSRQRTAAKPSGAASHAGGGEAAGSVPTKKRQRHGVMWVLGGGILQDKRVLQQWPLGLMGLGFAILLVGNRYYVEDLSREKMKTEERIAYLREHKIELQKSYQETIKISAIAEQLDTVGVGLKSGAPYGI